MSGKEKQAVLDGLWRKAMAGGDKFDMAAVRADYRSWREIMDWCLSSRDSSFEMGQGTWRGLAVVLEHPPLPTVSLVADAKFDEPFSEPVILSIECTDRRSGRAVYFNAEGNPQGYRDAA